MNGIVMPGAVRRVETLTPEAFQRDYLAAGIPVLVERPPAWRADVWNPGNLAAMGRDIEVTLELGDAMSGETRIRRDRLDRYVRRYLIDDAPPASGLLPYLSVFDLLEHFPRLREAMDFSLLAGAKRYERIRAWLGPAGTVTGYHNDSADNLFYQVFGAKLVSLVPPACDRLMYRSRKYDFMSVLSAADERDADRYPLFRQALNQRLEVVVESGQLLFIPKFWWHSVRGLSGSISVNCFAWSRREMPLLACEIARYWLHDAGLWGRRGGDRCVCHTTSRPRGTGLRAKFPRPFAA